MGRKSREAKGLEPVVSTGIKAEKSVIDKCKELHGSLRNALKYAAENPKP